MKRTILLAFLLVFLAGIAFADNEEPKKPIFGLHGVLLGSWAPIGVGCEFFLGPVGLGLQFTMLPFGVEDNFVFLYEPGAGIRVYFRRSLENAFYLGFSSHYCGAAGSLEGVTANVDGNVVRLNGLIGFNLLMGSNRQGRIAFEAGPRYNIATDMSTSTRSSWLFLHIQIIIGTVW